MKNSSSIGSNQDSYIRVPDFESRLEGLEFPPEVWAVFAHTERAVTCQGLAEKLGLSTEAVASAVRRLVRRKLVRKHLLNWRDYLAQAKLTPGVIPSESSIAPTLPPTVLPVEAETPSTLVVATESAAETVAHSGDEPSGLTLPADSMSEPSEAIVSVRIVDVAASQKRIKDRTNLVRVRLAADRTNMQFASSKSSSHAPTPSSNNPGGWRLRPLLDAIINRVGGLAGQFLVYRIFLRLPAELVEAAGIKSLSLVSDDFKIYDPRLRQAICETAREMAGVELAEIAA